MGIAFKRLLELRTNLPYEGTSLILVSCFSKERDTPILVAAPLVEARFYIEFKRNSLTEGSANSVVMVRRITKGFRQLLACRAASQIKHLRKHIH